MPHVTEAIGDDGVVVLTLDRAPANAFDLALLLELTAVMARLAGDPPAAVVLTGAHGFFSAGADLAAPPIGPQGVVHIDELLMGVFALTCPVIAAMAGHAVGIGFLATLACDLRIASDAGRYGLNEVKLGFPHPLVNFDLLRATVSARAASTLLLGSELLDAATCAGLGIVDEVVAPDAVLPRALDAARHRGAMPAQPYAETKGALRRPALEAMHASLAADVRAAAAAPASARGPWR
ncbi:enoyl-CoA hydratase/isomerase family protein [Baekduia soli]|uniref:enoyl-CoA hydratase/isomerase family protein n=1 Tax=Baekduia soli TaxID=496014 RepID=UPI0016523736|nr:enoyl-CoA hydratase/isomerase family protein [Baekduia soli]